MTHPHSLSAMNVMSWRKDSSQTKSNRALAASFFLLAVMLLPNTIQSQLVARTPAPSGPQVFLLKPPLTHNYNFPNLHLFTVQYGNGSVAAPLQPKAAQWLTSHFDYTIGSHIDLSAYPYALSAGYQDGAGSYTGALYSWVHDVAVTNGLKYEDMLLHLNQDYAVPSTLTWTNLDQFDYFEQQHWQGSGTGLSTMAIRGAFLQVGATYTDVTVALYDNKHKTTVASKLYLGYAESFDLVNLNVYTGRVGGSAAWEYWNGTAWAPLSLRTDTTAGVTTTGAVQFNPPANWAPTVVNGSRSKYWVRLNLTEATTSPVLTKVFGDDWLSHYGTNNSRGWSKTDSHRMNIGQGNLEYNPTPPANATARFRYQARATGNWAHNYTFMNPANQQKGQYSWIYTLLWSWAYGQSYFGTHYNGIFIDDLGIAPNTTPAFTVSMSDDLPVGTVWQNAEAAFYSAFYNQLKVVYGASYPVGANSSNWNITRSLDFNQNELSFMSWISGNAMYNNFAYMDYYLPAVNPKGTKSSFAGWDNLHFGYTGSDVFHIWDTANRSPMNILATYYIGSNPNTMLQYNTVGWTYYDADEYYYWSPATTTLSSALAANSATNSKTIPLTTNSAFTVPGGPIWTSSYVLKIGNDVVQAYKDSDTQFHTTTPILNSYPAGTVVKFAIMGHQSSSPIPDWHNVWYWANYFPAMSIDIGIPDAYGWKNGARDLNYVSSVAASGYPAGCAQANRCSEIWRRDFTKAIVLVRAAHDNTYPYEYDTYSPYIPLGGTYYPLYADGTSGPGITKIQLRAGESAILMKWLANVNHR